MIQSKLILARTQTGMNTYRRKLTIIANDTAWDRFVVQNYRHFQNVHSRSHGGVIIDRDNANIIEYEVRSNSIKVYLYGDETFVNEQSDVILEKFEEITAEIRWMYGTDGSTVDIPLQMDQSPCSEMYPWLNGEDLHSYYDRFIASSASILLLIGPPGTGKTTFIRGLLQHTKMDSVVTYDPAVLQKDYVFASFVESDAGAMVLEDADMFLRNRTEGNDMMHKFLNVGDGLVTTKGKKLIFSTNLPSINDIDPALVRAGRCFDIAHFDLLTQTQAETLATRMNVDLDGRTQDRWGVADVFHATRKQKKTPRVGFY
jgi:molybdopterin-guanine dinucleotide biosynthesis protein